MPDRAGAAGLGASKLFVDHRAFQDAVCGVLAFEIARDDQFDPDNIILPFFVRTLATRYKLIPICTQKCSYVA